MKISLKKFIFIALIVIAIASLTILGFNLLPKAPSNVEEVKRWSYDQSTQTISDGNIVLNIGDYVDYDCTTSSASYTSKANLEYGGVQTFNSNDYSDGWRVLGVDEKGQLLLLSENCVPYANLYGSLIDFYNLFPSITTDVPSPDELTAFRNCYANAVTELNNICSVYGEGNGAISARCITVEDINKITGYNPVTAETSYDDGLPYGSEITYTLTSDQIHTEGFPSSPIDISDSTLFTYWTGSEWKNLTDEESIKLKNTAYSYYPNTLTARSSDPESGLSTTSNAYKMLFTDPVETLSNINYWLASSGVRPERGAAGFGIYNVSAKSVSFSPIYYSRDLIRSDAYGVRAVVTLSSDLTLKDSGTQENDCTLWNINN